MLCLKVGCSQLVCIIVVYGLVGYMGSVLALLLELSAFTNLSRGCMSAPSVVRDDVYGVWSYVWGLIV